MKTDKSKTVGNPEESFELAIDLLKTFRTSKCYKNGVSNHHFAFDMMMGIGTFTALVLKTLEIASSSRIDLCKAYKDDILPTLCGDNPLESILNNHPELQEDNLATN